MAKHYFDTNKRHANGSQIPYHDPNLENKVYTILLNDRINTQIKKRKQLKLTSLLQTPKKVSNLEWGHCERQIDTHIAIVLHSSPFRCCGRKKKYKKS